VRWHGKPHRSVYDSVVGLLDVADRGRILAIGDSLRTDIAGAAAAGIPSLFIAGSGIHGAEFTKDGRLDQGRVEAAIREAGVNPVGVAAAFVW
jgi:ribonucleotide monophosphatase NagD (HAD superfamily)